jgi:hypothetical protein
VAKEEAERRLQEAKDEKDRQVKANTGRVAREESDIKTSDAVEEVAESNNATRIEATTETDAALTSSAPQILTADPRKETRHSPRQSLHQGGDDVPLIEEEEDSATSKGCCCSLM